MLPQFHFNFGPTSFDRFYQLSLPLVPGIILIGGMLVSYPALYFSLCGALGSSHLTLLLSLLVAYVAGFVLFSLSGILTGLVSGLVLGLCLRSWTPIRSSRELSRCSEWRKVATLFLGDKLVPKLPEIQAATVMEKVMAPMQNVTNKRQHDDLWEEWYRILQDYLLRDVPIFPNELGFIAETFHATGWTFVSLSAANHSHHWLVYVLAAILILYGALFPSLVVVRYMGHDRLTYWDFTARLVAETRAREIQGPTVKTTPGQSG